MELPETPTDQAVELYHRYKSALAQTHRLERELQNLLRRRDVNVTEYWKRMNTYAGQDSGHS